MERNKRHSQKNDRIPFQVNNTSILAVGKVPCHLRLRINSGYALFKISQVVILYVSDSVGNVSSVLENIDLLDRKKVIHHNCFVLAGN